MIYRNVINHCKILYYINVTVKQTIKDNLQILCIVQFSSINQSDVS